MESYTEKKREEIEGYLTLRDLWNMYCTCTIIVPVDLRPWLRESGYRLVTLSMTAVPSLPLLYLRTDKRLRYSYSSWTVCGRLTNFLVLYWKGQNQSLKCTGYSVENKCQQLLALIELGWRWWPLVPWMHNRQNHECDSLFKKVKHISGDFDKGIEFDTSFSNL